MRRSKFITAVLGSVLIAATMALNVGILNAEGTFTYDVDGNGIVNVMDLIRLKSYLLGEDEEKNTDPEQGGYSSYKITKDYIDAIKKIDADDVEIEKKWLIDKDSIPYDLSAVQHVIEIEQTYLNFSPEMRLRKYYLIIMLKMNKVIGLLERKLFQYIRIVRVLKLKVSR